MSQINMKMKSDQSGITEGGREVPVGTEVEYVCHEGWGVVRVRFEDGTEDVMSPWCFAQLRS